MLKACIVECRYKVCVQHNSIKIKRTYQHIKPIQISNNTVIDNVQYFFIFWYYKYCNKIYSELNKLDARQILFRIMA